MGFISSIVGGLLGANAAGNASNAQVKGAQQAQQEIQQNQQNAVGAQQTALGNITGAQQPYQNLGATSANHLADLVSGGFQAPTLAQAEQTPGYQFTLGQGLDAINRNAAANGTLMTGNTGKALTDYATGLASTTYQNDYQNALNTYMANYQSLMGGTNAGLNSTGQLTGANLNVANQTGAIDMNAANQIANQINNAANARASGYLGKANAYGSMLGGVAGGIGNMDFSGGSTGLEMLGQFAGI